MVTSTPGAEGFEMPPYGGQDRFVADHKLLVEIVGHSFGAARAGDIRHVAWLDGGQCTINPFSKPCLGSVAYVTR